jgi:RNA polymerase sigma-70 factor (ECF subfamily)
MVIRTALPIGYTCTHICAHKTPWRGERDEVESNAHPRGRREERVRAREEQLKALLVRGLAGDVTAYHAFLQDMSAHVRAFLRRRLAQWPDEVEDLVQETLLAIHNQRHTFDLAQPLSAWVYAIARYKCIDALRRWGRRDVHILPLHDALDVLAATDAAPAEARRDLAQLLDRLPARQRLPIVCMKIEGLSVAETARRTGMSAAAVKVAVHRGLKALAAKIREDP